MKHKQTMLSDKLFDIINYSIFIIFMIVVLYPLYWVVIASFSDPKLIQLGEIVIFPKGIDFSGYERIFAYDKLWEGYRNTIFYTVTGTFIGVSTTLLGGYALSRKDLKGNGLIMIFISITLFFNGGLIPTYLVVRDIGMENTVWAMIIPGTVSAFNVIIARTFFQSTIPVELLESAKMDNCGNFRFFWRIALPLSMPLVAVLTIFTAVAYWNSFFNALIYLRDETLYPLQLVLRNILILNDAQDKMLDPLSNKLDEKRMVAQQIKYGVIIISNLPILLLYPFLQKYFVKGIMIGAIKG